METPIEIPDNNLLYALFESFTGWEESEHCRFFLYDVKLKIDTANFKTDDVIESVYVDFEEGILEFYAEDIGNSSKTDNFTPMKVVETIKLKLELVFM